jgi:peroxiredoxin Q/BCP
MKMTKSFILTISLGILSNVFGASLKVGDKAPSFEAKLHTGSDFKLEDRKGKWTVLYFYPKAETPGCTKQACAFRDAVKVIQNLGADVYGVSIDGVDTQKKFHDHHNLTFDLIADPSGKAIKAYGTQMPVIGWSKRHTFVIDPELVIRDINTNVDPAKDPQVTADKIKELQAKK